MFVEFETSRGICRGELLDRGKWTEVVLDQDSEKTLGGLYRYVSVSYDRDSGWVFVELEDGYYGGPEYKAVEISDDTERTAKERSCHEDAGRDRSEG